MEVENTAPALSAAPADEIAMKGRGATPTGKTEGAESNQAWVTNIH